MYKSNSSPVKGNVRRILSPGLLQSTKNYIEKIGDLSYDVPSIKSQKIINEFISTLKNSPVYDMLDFMLIFCTDSTSAEVGLIDYIDINRTLSSYPNGINHDIKQGVCGNATIAGTGNMNIETTFNSTLIDNNHKRLDNSNYIWIYKEESNSAATILGEIGTSNLRIRNTLTTVHRVYSANIAKNINLSGTGLIGINRISLEEAHLYKNLTLNSNLPEVSITNLWGTDSFRTLIGNPSAYSGAGCSIYFAGASLTLYHTLVYNAVNTLVTKSAAI